jgi:general secretion pathway protein D
LTVEPSIHLGNELSLKMKIEVVRLGDQVLLQASPPITQFKFGNRSAETMLNIRDGETIVLGGLLQEEDRKTRTTIPWIGDLPFIGNLVSSFKTQRVTTEVILTITPHIIQGTTPPGLTTQVFWSGTDSSYSTSPMFTPKGKKISLLGGGASGAELSSSRGSAKGGMAGKAAVAALTPMASIGAVASIRPDAAVIQLGQEFKLAINDERLRPTADGMFQLQYDPQVLEFRKLLNGQVIQSDGRRGQTSGRSEAQVGMVAFKVAPSVRQAGGRTVTVTFYAKALGVSPVRVALVDSAAESSTVPLQDAKGIVRVR